MIELVLSVALLAILGAVVRVLFGVYAQIGEAAQPAKGGKRTPSAGSGSGSSSGDASAAPATASPAAAASFSVDALLMGIAKAIATAMRPPQGAGTRSGARAEMVSVAVQTDEWLPEILVPPVGPPVGDVHMPGAAQDTPPATPPAAVAAAAKPAAAVASAAGAADGDADFVAMSDEELRDAVLEGKLPSHKLEPKLGDLTRAVGVRRQVIHALSRRSFAGIPYETYDYTKVQGACCELVVGVMPLPLGVFGPLVMKNEDGSKDKFWVPLATTEGCLVASTNRGCKAIAAAGGCEAVVTEEGMSRGPCLRMPSAAKAAAVKRWIDDPDNWELLKSTFESTSRFARLQYIKVKLAGRNVFARFVAKTGDAMGMNMISKGTTKVLEKLLTAFPEMQVTAVSGNFCTDKKPAAINWIDGRGKSVVCEVLIPRETVKKVLKTTPEAIADTNVRKNLIGSARAGAMGGFNAHAANIVAGVFIACGQDPAQVVESSACMTLMEVVGKGDLLASVTMPSIEVGTVGGGTFLDPQSACLDLVKCKGPDRTTPGGNARRFARVVAGSVLAGELSLMAALTTGDLVRAHMKHNRSSNSLDNLLTLSTGGAGGGSMSTSSTPPSTPGGACVING